MDSNKENIEMEIIENNNYSSSSSDSSYSIDESSYSEEFEETVKEIENHKWKDITSEDEVYHTNIFESSRGPVVSDALFECIYPIDYFFAILPETMMQEIILMTNKNASIKIDNN